MAASRGATALWWLVASVLGGVLAEDYVIYEEETTTNKPAARTLATAVLHSAVDTASLVGKFIWLFGGMDANGQSGYRNDLWSLELSTKAWTSAIPTGDTPSSRLGHTMIVHKSKAYVFAGEATNNNKLKDLYMLHLDGSPSAEPRWEDTSSNCTGTPPPKRTKHTAVLAKLKNVAGNPWGMLVFGGLDSGGAALNDLHQLNLETLVWDELATTGTVPQERMSHSAAAIDDDTLVVFGGAYTLGGGSPTLFQDVWLYDVYRGVWRQAVPQTSSRPVERDGHAMVVISDNVYIFGGVNSEREKLADMWTFNKYAALAGRLDWKQPVAMSATPAARHGHVAMVSLNSMLLLGGMDNAGAVLDDVYEMSTGCTGSVTLSASRGVFSDGDGLYDNGQDCRWVLDPTTPQSNVRLVVTELDLRDDGDRLEIYDGSSTSGTLLASYTGSSVPPSIASTGSAMLVRLTTNGGGMRGTGFAAGYQAVCKAGYTWDTVSLECRPCPAGSFSDHPDAEGCAPCPFGTFAEDAGSASCDRCQEYANTSATGTFLQAGCQCQSGYFGWDNECRHCPEGAMCPGDKLVSARTGWCGTSNSSTSFPSFAHCCRPELCPGGLNAQCDITVGLVGGSSCAVSVISWDTLHLVSLTNGTWATFVLILFLSLLICFCTGLSIGVRRAVRRQIDSLVVPVQKPPPTPDRRPATSASRRAREDRIKAFDDDDDKFGSAVPGPALPPTIMRTPPTSATGSGRPPAQSAMMGGGEETGGADEESDEELLVVDIEDPTLGANAPPPIDDMCSVIKELLTWD